MRTSPGIQGGTDQIARVGWNGQILTVLQQRVRPVCSAEAGSTWKLTDTAGHEHTFGTPEDPYPTLTRMSDGWAGPPDCGEDDHAASDFEYYHLVCTQCEELVWPAPGGPGTEYMPRSFFYAIDDAEVSRIAARKFVEQIHQDDPDRWGRLYGWLKYSADLLPPIRRTWMRE